MAKARSDAQFAHEVALVNLFGNALSKTPRPPEAFKPWKELPHGK